MNLSIGPFSEWEIRSTIKCIHTPVCPGQIEYLGWLFSGLNGNTQNPKGKAAEGTKIPFYRFFVSGLDITCYQQLH